MHQTGLYGWKQDKHKLVKQNCLWQESIKIQEQGFESFIHDRHRSLAMLHLVPDVEWFHFDFALGDGHGRKSKDAT